MILKSDKKVKTYGLVKKMISELYDVTVNTINGHIFLKFNDGELSENSVIRKYRITAVDEKNYNTMHYNL